MSSLLYSTRTATLLAFIAALTFLSTAVISTRVAPETYPVADTATTSLYTLRAARGELATGSYSRYGWNHPGPLLYQLLAGPYLLSGGREISLKWAALAINIISLAVLLTLVSRRSALLAVAIIGALAPLLWREQRLLFSAWNPFVPVLALAWAMAAAASLATGRGWRSFWGAACLVIPLSLCVQAHAGLIIPSTICVLAAVVGLWPMATATRADRSGLRIPLIWAGLVAAVLWATPLLGEMRNSPSNLGMMATFLLDDHLPRTSWARALFGASYMTLGSFLPGWTVMYGEVPRNLPSWLPFGWFVLVTGVAWCALDAGRRGRHFDAAFAAIAAAVSVAVVVAAKGIIGPVSDYLLLWGTAAGALDVAVVLAAILGRFAILRRYAATVHAPLVAICLLAWTLVGGIRLTGKHAEQARDTTVRALSLDLLAYCRTNGITRPLLTYPQGDAWQEAVGIVLQLSKIGHAVAVDDGALFLFGRTFARQGTEDAEFYLMPVASEVLPPHTERTEWVTTRGTYRILKLHRP